MLEHGEVQSMFKLRATSCLFSAIEHSTDAVEIASADPDKPELQVEVQKKKTNKFYFCFNVMFRGLHSLNSTQHVFLVQKFH